MKTRVGYIITIFTLFNSLLFGQQVLDRIVAIVDDGVILESEITQSAYFMGMQMGIDPLKNPKQFTDLKQDALNSEINKKLLLIQADKDTLVADERQVDNYLQQDIQRIIQQVGGEDKLEENVGMPMSRFRRTRRQEISNDMRANMAQEKKVSAVSVSRREVQDFYKAHEDSIGSIKETVDISHILITPKAGENAKEEAYKRLKELRKRIVDGEDFGEMAKKYSEDPGSAVSGGDFGFASRSTLVREYAEAASRLNPGELSDIVETQFGYHLIRLEEKRGDKIHTSHILISVKPDKDDEKASAELIKQIASELENGADFKTLVDKYSEDESTNKLGGHLGRFEVDQLRQMAKEFVFALDGVPVGGYSHPVKTQYGFHVLKLNSKEEPRKYNMEQDWDTIEGMALQYKKQKELQKWMTEIKKEIFVEEKEPYKNN